MNDVRLAVTLPELTRTSTSPSGSTSADTVAGAHADDDAVAGVHAVAAAVATKTAAAATTNSVAAVADPRWFMPFGWLRAQTRILRTDDGEEKDV